MKKQGEVKGYIQRCSNGRGNDEFPEAKLKLRRVWV